MGLHSGFIVATATRDELFTEMSRHTGEFTVRSVVERTEDAELRSGEFDLMVGELDGRAFVVDTSFVLSNSADMIVTMSARLGTVVACGAETVSGSYWLTAARDGDLLRHIMVSRAGTTRGMAIGEPLGCEQEHPLEDLSGGGVFAAMAEFGLSPSAWMDSGPAIVIGYDYSRPPPSGRITEIQRDHYERYKRPDGEWLKDVKVVVTNAAEES